MVPNKSFEVRRCSNYGKSNYRESTVTVIMPVLFYYTDLPTIACQRLKIVNVLVFNVPMLLCTTVVNKNWIANK